MSTTPADASIRTAPTRQTPVPRAQITGPVDLGSVLSEGVAESSLLSTSSSGGEHLRASRIDSAIDRALPSISDFEASRSSQQKDHFPSRVKADLLQKEPSADTPLVAERYLLDDNDLLWYKGSEQKRHPGLAAPRIMVPETLSLVHAIHGHPGVVATLILLRECFL